MKSISWAHVWYANMDMDGDTWTKNQMVWRLMIFSLSGKKLIGFSVTGVMIHLLTL